MGALLVFAPIWALASLAPAAWALGVLLEQDVEKYSRGGSGV